MASEASVSAALPPPILALERQYSDGAEAHHYDIAHFYSRPLTSETNGEKRRIDMLDVVQEQRDLKYAIENAGRAVRYRSEIATVRAFEDAFRRTCRVLHFSGHGTAAFLAFERDSKVRHLSLCCLVGPSFTRARRIRLTIRLHTPIEIAILLHRARWSRSIPTRFSA